jgi:hypothetical protein
MNESNATSMTIAQVLASAEKYMSLMASPTRPFSESAATLLLDHARSAHDVECALAHAVARGCRRDSAQIALALTR